MFKSKVFILHDAWASHEHFVHFYIRIGPKFLYVVANNVFLTHHCRYYLPLGQKHLANSLNNDEH